MNLFTLPPAQPEELTEPLAEGSARIERIVSWGQRSPDGFWYDQTEDEWVSVLAGHARLRFSDRELTLSAGDSLLIPAHRRHRVEETSADPPCVWLCVFGKLSSIAEKGEETT